MTKVRVLALAIAIAAATPAIAKEKDAAPVAPSPAIWRVADADSEIYLLGTFGMLPQGAVWRSRAIAGAIDASETLWFEAPVGDAAAQESANRIFAAQGTLGGGRTLSALLAPEQRDALGRIAAALKMPIASLDALKPWAAFVVLSSQVHAREGINLAEGVDAALTREALDRGRALRFFDSIDGALGVLTAMPQKTQIELLSFLIDDWARQQETALAGFEAWRSGDIAATDAFLNRAMRETAPAAYQVLVEERTQELADGIGDILGGRGTAFVALNASYLVGAGSLPKALAARGHAVERIGEKEPEKLKAD